MFRFAFRNEQKEMLGRTIAELREIKAELSVLTESLKLIVPGERQNQEISVSTEECRDIAGEGFSPPCDGGDCTGPLRPDGVCVEESEEAVEQCPEEEAAPVKSSESAERPEDDPAEAAQCMAVQESKLYREWAVVNIFDIKRPWWKIWKSKNHLIRRSI